MTVRKPTPEELGLRAHDIMACMESTRTSDFDQLNIIGLAVRLALHLKGVETQTFDTIRNVAVHLLNFQVAEVKPALELLESAEMLILSTQGKTIRTVTPDIPFFGDLYKIIGERAAQDGVSEPEEVAVSMMGMVSGTPVLTQKFYEIGADKRLVDRLLTTGAEAGYMTITRARGRDVALSPSYFSESPQAYADLVAAGGSPRLKRLLELLRLNPGWPLSKIESEKEIAGHALDAADIATLKKLAGDGFLAPPSITTTHSGANFFLFGPKPGLGQIPQTHKEIFERAMALVAAVRQGQFLPAQYAVRSPVALLQAFKDRGKLRANTEAGAQYRQLAKLKVARIESLGGGWCELRLIDTQENKMALDMAIALMSGDSPRATPDVEITLALQQGHEYVESLIGRKRVVQSRLVHADPEVLAQIDSFLLRGV